MREKKSHPLNFIKHRVRVRVDGFRPERLISRAAADGIGLRNIVYKDETEVAFTVSGTDLSRLKKLAGSKYRITKISEGGAVPAAGRIKKGKMAAAGFLLFLLVFISQTLFIREINIVGCRTITETSIRNAIAEEGLYEGALKRFNCDEIEKKLFRNYENIVWARVAYEGNYVEVQISESRQAREKTATDTKPCHIAAEEDCYIERIYAYNGRAQVQKGDFVKKGGILISGKVPIEHPTYPVEEGKKLYHYKHASGKVIARIPYYFSFYMEPQESEKNRDREANRLLRHWIKENVPESAEILKKDFHFDAKKNIIRVYGTIETRRQVGIEKEIVIDKHQRGTKEISDRR